MQGEAGVQGVDVGGLVAPAELMEVGDAPQEPPPQVPALGLSCAHAPLQRALKRSVVVVGIVPRDSLGARTAKQVAGH